MHWMKEHLSTIACINYSITKLIWSSWPCHWYTGCQSLGHLCWVLATAYQEHPTRPAAFEMLWPICPTNLAIIQVTQILILVHFSCFQHQHHELTIHLPHNLFHLMTGTYITRWSMLFASPISDLMLWLISVCISTEAGQSHFEDYF